MCVIVTILLMIETDFFSDQQSDFITYQFPIFRGTLVLFIYILLLGIDVYIWEKANINYKKAFNIQLVYTNPYEIITVGFGFLAIWMLTFLYCGLSNSPRLALQKSFFNSSVASYFPPFLWVIFFGFLFFPTRRWFHGKARMFVICTLKNLFFSPVLQMTVLISFTVDQMT